MQIEGPRIYRSPFESGSTIPSQSPTQPTKIEKTYDAAPNLAAFRTNLDRYTKHEISALQVFGLSNETSIEELGYLNQAVKVALRGEALGGKISAPDFSRLEKGFEQVIVGLMRQQSVVLDLAVGLQTSSIPAAQRYIQSFVAASGRLFRLKDNAQISDLIKAVTGCIQESANPTDGDRQVQGVLQAVVFKLREIKEKAPAYEQEKKRHDDLKSLIVGNEFGEKAAKDVATKIAAMNVLTPQQVQDKEREIEDLQKKTLKDKIEELNKKSDALAKAEQNEAAYEKKLEHIAADMRRKEGDLRQIRPAPKLRALILGAGSVASGLAATIPAAVSNFQLLSPDWARVLNFGQKLCSGDFLPNFLHFTSVSAGPVQNFLHAGVTGGMYFGAAYLALEGLRSVTRHYLPGSKFNVAKNEVLHCREQWTKNQDDRAKNKTDIATFTKEANDFASEKRGIEADITAKQENLSKHREEIRKKEQLEEEKVKLDAKARELERQKQENIPGLPSYDKSDLMKASVDRLLAAAELTHVEDEKLTLKGWEKKQP